MEITSFRSLPFSRRRGLSLAAGATALAAAGSRRPADARHMEATPAAGEDGTIPISGEAVPELAGLDRTMTDLMTRWQIPGGQLALAKEGRLVFNRGYGLADVDANEPVQPDARFRIASVSKAITAVAILALVDDGRLALTDKVFPLLDLAPPVNASVDPRLGDITIEHLLVHAGGWDSDANFEPQAPPWSEMAAFVLGEPHPASAETIVRFMAGMPLDFDPGSRSVYSNFGFNVLGRVIERVSGQTYEDFTLNRVLAPAGAGAMRLARTRREERAPGEVRYYGPAGQRALPSVFPGEGFSPLAHGAYSLEAFDAHGGWLASAADLARFATAVDGQGGEPLLAPATIEVMLHTPRPLAAAGAVQTFGLGWNVGLSDDGANWSHAGALLGSSTAWLERTTNGLTIAFVFNTQPEEMASFFPEAVEALREAAAQVGIWPEHDLV